jgi:hypothetical protein
MLKVDKINISNFEGAFRGLRNPMNSWEKSDSFFDFINLEYFNEYTWDIKDDWLNVKDINEDTCTLEQLDEIDNWLYENSIIRDSDNGYYGEVAVIGPKDMELAQRMIGGGTEESKFMRQIFVSMDIDAPLFWWKEMDTYKVGTVSNSCSTMHKITSAPITMENFSFGPYIEFYPMYEKIIEYCEGLRQKYLETKDKRYWRALIEILPEAWNQKRTWTANYQVLRNIYFQRRYHKLEEWHQFCDAIEKLPYGKELICYEKKEV